MPPQVTQSFLKLPSFAKINWRLQILGKRADGYHEVFTLLQTISIHDELQFEITEADEISISCNEPEIPTGDQNLVFRAAAALRERYKVSSGIQVRLEKRIPAQAGLGGASSNAAITLLACAHLWGLKASPDALLEIAKGLGADVPFFLFGGCAAGTGTGAKISPVADETDGEQWLIVVTPRAGVSTRKAYAALSSPALTTNSGNSILSSSQNEAKNGDSQQWPLQDSLINDFESVIFDIEPEIGRVKRALIQAGATGALLAGSGSSVFGIFAGRADQERAVSKIKLETGWRMFPCVTVSRNEYLRSLAALDVSFLRSFNS